MSNNYPYDSNENNTNYTAYEYGNNDQPPQYTPPVAQPYNNPYGNGYIDAPPGEEEYNNDPYAPPPIYQPSDTPYAPPEHFQNNYYPNPNEYQNQSMSQADQKDPPQYNSNTPYAITANADTSENVDVDPAPQPAVTNNDISKPGFPYTIGPRCIQEHLKGDHEDVISRHKIPRLKFPLHFTLWHWLVWVFSLLIWLGAVGGGCYVWYRYAFSPVVLGIDPNGHYLGPLRWFAVGSYERGVFAVGQWSYGIFSVGQLSFGFVTLGQVSVGLISVGQAGVGLFFMIGQACLSFGIVPIAQVAVASWVGICQLGLASGRVVMAQIGVQLFSPFFSTVHEYTDNKVFERQNSRKLFVTCHKKRTT